MTRPLVVHLGCSKTGTSSLQLGLWRSVEALAAVGVGLPFVDREDHMTRLVRPLGWKPVEAFVRPPDEAALGRVAEHLRRTPGERLLVSNEELAEVGRPQAERIAAIAADADLDLRLVLTVRGWADQLPSEYQQFVKHRMTLTYAEFIDAVRSRTGVWAERFWRRQDPLQVLDPWTGLVAPQHVHVIGVPSYAQDPDGVFRLLGEAAGVDHRAIVRPPRAINASYGVVETEAWRRVNVALGDRLPGFTRDYGGSLRFPFERGGALPTQASARIGLPAEIVPWLQEHGGATRQALAARGYRLSGDLDRLVPPDDAGRPVVVPDEAEVAARLAQTLADLAVLHSERVERLRAERRQA